MHDNFDHCYRAVQARDTRFDGSFVTAVRSTGIYCRPSCPARTPLARNVRFYPTAAAAQHDGFRACKRCRPHAAPGSPEWDTRGDVVARAMRLIADGTIDRERVTGLAATLGYTPRQLERLLRAEVGATAVTLARAQRAQTARILIETTELAFGDLAFAAGFSSIRQFNDTVRSVYGLTPTDLRRQVAAETTSDAIPVGALTLRLPVREPFAFEGLFAHLAATAVPGCEEVRNRTYRRTLRLPRGTAIVSLTPQRDHVRCVLELDDLRDLSVAIARCRRLLDLDADPEAVDDALGAEDALRTLVRQAPGQRIPRTVDGHELALRAVLGQQVSTRAARTITAVLVRSYGAPVIDTGGGLTHCFPTAAEVTQIDPALLRVPAARRRTLTAMATALAEGDVVLDAGADWDRARAQLRRIPGIGPWTSELIAMRGLGDPDAFPSSDLGIRTAARSLGLPDDPRSLTDLSARWRPWRSYAAQYLWSALDHPINQWPPQEAA